MPRQDAAVERIHPRESVVDLRSLDLESAKILTLPVQYGAERLTSFKASAASPIFAMLNS